METATARKAWQRRAQLIRRGAAAQAQRGAAMFVVLLAILLLSGLGMWSMHSAALVDRASGYSRAALQTQYVAEMGVLAATGYLSLPSMASVNYKMGQLGDSCESVASGFCKSLWPTDLRVATSADLTDEGTAAGSFSPVADELQSDFTVEITSLRRAIVPGSPLTADSPYRLVTLTSYGTLRPHTGSTLSPGKLCTNGTSATSSAPQNGSAGRVTVRSHAIIGPIQ